MNDFLLQIAERSEEIKQYFDEEHWRAQAGMLAAFATLNSIRVLAYIPQLVKAARDSNGALAISYITWGLFAACHRECAREVGVGSSKHGIIFHQLTGSKSLDQLDRRLCLWLSCASHISYSSSQLSLIRYPTPRTETIGSGAPYILRAQRSRWIF